MLHTLIRHFKKWYLLASVALMPTLSHADRYGICEDGANCGGGAFNGVVGSLLVLVFLGFLGFKRAGIFLFVWLAPTILAFKMGEKGYAALWGLFGFYLSFLVTPLICGFLGLDKTDESNHDSNK